jgi:hypothetical protein
MLTQHGNMVRLPYRGAQSAQRVMSGATSGAKPTSRRRERDLRVPVRPEEAQIIEAQARAVGMTIAAYLRAVGTGYQPRAIVDRDQVNEMLRVNGDLGRLGGLLKLWLSDDTKLAAFDRGQIRQVILSALRRIEENQAELRSVVRRALRDRGEP